MIVVAIADKPDLAIAAGATPRGYSSLPDYSGSARSQAAAKRLAMDYSLREVSAWTIDALHVRCMLYELPADVDRDAALEQLRADKRVDLAQALQEFQTYATQSPATAVVPATSVDPRATTILTSACSRDSRVSMRQRRSAGRAERGLKSR